MYSSGIADADMCRMWSSEPEDSAPRIRSCRFFAFASGVPISFGIGVALLALGAFFVFVGGMVLSFGEPAEGTWTSETPRSSKCDRRTRHQLTTSTSTNEVSAEFTVPAATDAVTVTTAVPATPATRALDALGQ